MAVEGILDGLFQFTAIHQTRDLLEYPAFAKHHHRRNRSDTELGRDFRIVIDIALAHRDLTVVVGRQGVDGGADGFAGAAPGSPEIHQDQLRRLEDRTGEILIGDFGNVCVHGDILSVRVFVYDPYERRQAKMLHIRGEISLSVQAWDTFDR